MFCLRYVIVLWGFPLLLRFRVQGVWRMGSDVQTSALSLRHTTTGEMFLRPTRRLLPYFSSFTTLSRTCIM